MSSKAKKSVAASSTVVPTSIASNENTGVVADTTASSVVKSGKPDDIALGESKSSEGSGISPGASMSTDHTSSTALSSVSASIALPTSMTGSDSKRNVPVPVNAVKPRRLEVLPKDLQERRDHHGFADKYKSACKVSKLRVSDGCVKFYCPGIWVADNVVQTNSCAANEIGTRKTD